MPGAMCGTRAPTAKNLVATAIPIWPEARSVAMIDQVIGWRLGFSTSCRVALHAPGIGGSATTAAEAGCSGQSAFRPIGSGFDDMAAARQLVARGLRHTVFDHEYAGPRGARPERNREMLGMPGRRVDRLLQIEPGVDVAQEELRDPLILLVAAGRTPGQVRFAVTQRHGRRKRGARTLSGGERGGMILLQPEHLRAAAKAEADLRDNRRRLQPTAGRRGRYHVATLVDNIEMHGVAAHLAETADRRLAPAHGADGFAMAFGTAQLDDRAEACDRAGKKIERGLVGDQLTPL